jgi:hypothetical protein
LTITEVNFDDNGLKDHSFALILTALQDHPHLKKINYSNNELGEKSLPLLAKIITRPTTTSTITELRFCGIKSSPMVMRDLFKAIREAPAIETLRLSNMNSINGVIFEELEGICKNDS